MTPIEQAVLRKLLATAAVTALVSQRVYQLKLPQGPTYPAIKVQLIDRGATHHLRGGSKTFRTRVQVDSYAYEASGTDPYAVVSTVADAVFDALDGKAPFTTTSPSDLRVTGAFLIDRTPGYESEELKIVRLREDYWVWGKKLT